MNTEGSASMLPSVQNIKDSKASIPIQKSDDQASQPNINAALERTNSAQTPQSGAPILFKAPESSTHRGSGSFSKLTFNSMIGGLSALSLSRTSSNGAADDKEKEFRGRTSTKDKRQSASAIPPDLTPDTSRSRSRARSQSPFSFRMFRPRELSPAPEPLHLTRSDSDISEASTMVVRPRTAFHDDADSGDETAGYTDGETEDEGWSDDDLFDPVTERNTEKNAMTVPVLQGDGHNNQAEPDADADVDIDPTGEGVNVVIPPEPYFPSTLNSSSAHSSRGKRGPRRRKSTRLEPLPITTSRPVFQRDRCTITISQGHPAQALLDRRKRTYVVASDMSEESRYAVEWGIGTVLRDGDEMMIVNVIENESKVDPFNSTTDRGTKLRSQQERQGLAYILARQATSLLQRTKLNVTVICQAWHAKNARHMLLDIVDHKEPTMLIVGSRGLGQIKGILLGSTSHYLIQKCSVPVMVARRRLKRPPRRSAHLSTHRTHVSLAEAGIDRVAPKVDQDVKVMRDELERDDDRREKASSGVAQIEDDGDEDAKSDDESAAGVKIAG